MEQILDNSNSNIRSNHNMSYNWLGSTDFGRLVPFHVQELVPTDKVVRCAPRIEMQMLPLVAPTFGQMDLYVHYFFVPTRLIWKNSPDFFSESGVNMGVTPPYWTLRDMNTAYAAQSSGVKRALFNHWTSFGLPPFFTSSSSASDTASNNRKITTLPFRAYNQIWWDFYRDAELIADSSKSNYLNDSDGRDETAASLMKHYPKYQMIKSSWIADLFASNGSSPSNFYVGLVAEGNTSTPGSSRNVNTNGGGTTAERLRQVEALTRMAERMSLSGKRQIDRLFAKYGVKPEFAKLNMCQYLGGAKSSVLVSDITSSADTAIVPGESIGAPLGTKAGSGYCTFNNVNIKFTASEPGYLIGIFHVMPKIHFVQGLGKQWFRNSVNDFFRKELEHVGQVAVAKSEIGIQYGNMTSGYTKANDLDTFAFTQPYYEYKRNTDIIAGDFMTYHDSDLSDYDMHYMEGMGLYQDYPANRLYNAENLTIKPENCNKIFYYQGGGRWTDSDDHFHLNINLDCVINRPMDGYAVPSLETTENPHQSKSPIHSETQL